VQRRGLHGRCRGALRGAHAPVPAKRDAAFGTGRAERDATVPQDERPDQVQALQGVPPFVVASDRTLREIAARQPRTTDELMKVYGIGATKAARYGRGFLEVVARALSPQVP